VIFLKAECMRVLMHIGLWAIVPFSLMSRMAPGVSRHSVNSVNICSMYIPFLSMLWCLGSVVLYPCMCYHLIWCSLFVFYTSINTCSLLSMRLISFALSQYIDGITLR